MKNPTVNLADIVAMFVIDPLGSSWNATTQYIAAMGGEQSAYNDTATMNDFMDEIWPSETGVKLLKTRRDAVGRFGSTNDVVTGAYSSLCGSNCLADGGVPSIWLAQPSFQKYRTYVALQQRMNDCRR